MDRTLWVFNVVLNGLLADPEISEGEKILLRETSYQLRQIILESKRDAIAIAETEGRPHVGDAE